ncbi:MAG: radical SAM protein [Planctomycetes bacterium]|nr:radical SAM protein [Planctomycetota bacterium]
MAGSQEPANAGSRIVTPQGETYLVSARLVAHDDPDGEGAVVWNALRGRPILVPRETARALRGEGPAEIPPQALHELVAKGHLARSVGDEKAGVDERVARYVDEIRGGSKVAYLRLIVADDCNFACTYCIHDRACPARDGTRPRRMSFETARRAVDLFLEFLRSSGRTAGTICFDGGEPLLARDVVTRTIDYARQAERPDVGLELILATNGVLLDERTAAWLGERKVVIGMSLDGIGGVNDLVRRTAGGKGTFASIVGKIDLLERIGHPLTGLSATIARETVGVFGRELIDFARSRGMKWLRFDPDILDMRGVDATRMAERLLEGWRLGTASGIDVIGFWTRPATNLLATGENKEFLGFCLAARGETVAIDPRGEIVPCPHSRVRIGHLDDLEGGLGPIFSGEGRYERYVLENTVGRIPACRGCEIEGFCAGGCAAAREIRGVTGEEGAEPTLCEIYRQATRRLVAERLRGKAAV